MSRTTQIEVLSLSASDVSVSRACVPALCDSLATCGFASHVTDIRDLPPVWGSNRNREDLPAPYANLIQRVDAASGVIFCLPVYCYTASGAAKTISEIIGGTEGALTRKPVAFLVASGSIRSHLSVSDLMSSMAFEQYTFCYPRHVSVQSDQILKDGGPSNETRTRIAQMAHEFTAFCDAISTMKYTERNQ